MVFITKYSFFSPLFPHRHVNRRPATKCCSGTGLHAEKKGNDELLEAVSVPDLAVSVCTRRARYSAEIYYSNCYKLLSVGLHFNSSESDTAT